MYAAGDGATDIPPAMAPDDAMAFTANLVTSTRTITAAGTLAIIQPLLLDYDIHGYADHTPVGMASIRAIEVFRGMPRSGYFNLGKGFGIDSALASGFMEAIEMCTIEQAPQVPVLAAGALAPDSCVYSAASNAMLRAGQLGDRRVIAGVDLLTSMPVHGLVDDYFLPDNDRGETLHVSTNGLASGNTLAEARLHALYELIERHVTAASLHALRQVMALVLEDVPAPLRDTLAELAAGGWSAEFFLLGVTLEVPVIQCVLAPSARGSQACVDGLDLSFGWGADHSLATALARALAEAVQGWAIRAACMAGVIPASRMPGGLLVAQTQLLRIKTGTHAGEKTLHARLRACSRKTVSLAVDVTSTAPADALEQLLRSAGAADIAHALSWTLSPSQRPFAVVRCVMPHLVKTA